MRLLITLLTIIQYLSTTIIITDSFSNPFLKTATLTNKNNFHEQKKSAFYDDSQCKYFTSTSSSSIIDTKLYSVKGLMDELGNTHNSNESSSARVVFVGGKGGVGKIFMRNARVRV